jgi:hypothetical protein
MAVQASLGVFEMEHMFAQVETALEEAGVHRRAPQRTEGCAFADLSGTHG